MTSATGSRHEKVWMSPKKNVQRESAERAAVVNKESSGFTEDERAAMKERAQEL
ncbi:MAG: hypothetical protein H6Q10_1892, partial [Acidobacteria bacterium]|nr:hypothetical protein [Acidobacteriota bacterium]